MDTTAIYPNRVDDKLQVENKIGIPEFGNDSIDLYVPGGPLFSKGYVRVVYGDHGPYIEFEEKHILIPMKSKFNNFVDTENLPPLDYKWYYFWLCPRAYPDIKVYLQIKPVTSIPNAPKRADGKPSCFNRAEGYADYRRGCFYVDPFQLEYRGSR